MGYKQVIEFFMIKIKTKTKKPERKNPYKSYRRKKNKVLLTCDDGNIRVIYSNMDRSWPQDT